MALTQDSPEDEAAKISWRRHCFHAATVGMRAWSIAKACNELRPGFDFRGETKAELCREFVDGYLRGYTPHQLENALLKQRMMT